MVPGGLLELHRGGRTLQRCTSPHRLPSGVRRQPVRHWNSGPQENPRALVRRTTIVTERCLCRRGLERASSRLVPPAAATISAHEHEADVGRGSRMRTVPLQPRATQADRKGEGGERMCSAAERKENESNCGAVQGAVVHGGAAARLAPRPSAISRPFTERFFHRLIRGDDSDPVRWRRPWTYTWTWTWT